MHIELGMAKDTGQNGFSFEQQKDYSPTKFVYFGDAQNDILAHWSRVIRMAYQTAGDATFAIHAGI